jgi:hypothetical protein
MEDDESLDLANSDLSGPNSFLTKKKRIAFYNGFGTFNAKSAQHALNSANLQKPFKKGGLMMEGCAGDPSDIVSKPGIQN